MTSVSTANRSASTKPWKPYRVVPKSWWPDLWLLVAFLAFSALLVWPTFVVEFDVWMREFVEAHRPAWAYYVSRVLIFSGQFGLLGVVALALASIVAYRSRTIRPLLALIVTYLITGGILILKVISDRVAPRWKEDESDPTLPFADVDQALLFSNLEPSMSYPSGHVLNTIVWFGFIVLLVGSHMRSWQRHALRWTPPIIATVAMIVLSWHWVSDVPAGIFIGFLILRFILRINWATMRFPPALAWLEPENKILGIPPATYREFFRSSYAPIEPDEQRLRQRWPDGSPVAPKL
ncbi:phosphatase PAP2 family protein [Natronoglycomyces albus]|uniref:Phosphatase PAP2 family protein n=1 Tax=Natronoglycomyces albus TaxID=2811108 RepID=A0A895XIJ3_9ACTN|nr:phosphatase PAP2 family protein [Natronoglycomyces albus]QSB04777.1 phosphatase PAP2 family protein [Natronoglycomyces albus]